MLFGREVAVEVEEDGCHSVVVIWWALEGMRLRGGCDLRKRRREARHFLYIELILLGCVKEYECEAATLKYGVSDN